MDVRGSRLMMELSLGGVERGLQLVHQYQQGENDILPWEKQRSDTNIRTSAVIQAVGGGKNWEGRGTETCIRIAAGRGVQM
jgi:hypothetical protein